MTGVETDSGWNEAIWSDGNWPMLVWAVTGVALVAAGFALLEAIKRTGSKRRVVIGLAVEALAAAALIALAFAVPST